MIPWASAHDHVPRSRRADRALDVDFFVAHAQEVNPHAYLPSLAPEIRLLCLDYLAEGPLADSGDQYITDCRYPPAPSHYGDAAAFAVLLAQRYPNAAGIEVWNEENLSEFWAPTPDVGAYMTLLGDVYTAVKAAVPSMPVVMGGLAASGVYVVVR